VAVEAEILCTFEAAAWRVVYFSISACPLATLKYLQHDANTKYSMLLYEIGLFIATVRVFGNYVPNKKLFL